MPTRRATSQLALGGEIMTVLRRPLPISYGAQNGITVKSNSDSELGMRLVAYLPELHCAVDIAGATVTEKREQSVKAHICQSNRLGYYLIKRTADASQMAAEIKTLFIILQHHLRKLPRK